MIRSARPEDVDAVAPLLILGMGHIAGIFARSDNHADAIPFFREFFLHPANQYSYANTLVFETEAGIIGSINGYDGALLHELRQPVLDKLREADPTFDPNDETEPGEYYIDCVNVHPDHQGKGIGKKLINALCEHAGALGHARVGLIVDRENPAAKRLYEKLNFQVAGEKDFMGHRYFHMVRESS
ncbi:ribosomal protein S18 acetylase RimI-like enzyme [Dyadobacter sp. BE34]|uniref:Ribosomal protein S18 acetylase RimI-like enzyme n=1 Tax=Dyadobacter fermentans TaxID=94254 RepID=A0ABU1QQ67_9BACT|nr:MULTISPECIES: GNAT family N-acetyltransferase [Dyadobacter]MDR6803242.1 ribosomal protein S18 acetylase RimI-like enzyme [Dyadobacter fermentans]MDR7040983.1 ribosomal protein S18 acetylase RimI-like enzyme [Dyadobacter sp. BE242]MDR7195386.1 ribosomal protein S18 acetylase RimI-like enzyme [Dyadobacter sp. BE34]MDR7214069.1 ribosomal protein S18 acetylase RimI-like enzyme [Dyadobacter sp. BE31]MDR7260793.1 ribosomal protein S18 acetylase RimI-like enzyme [Dyadobacter sp. BE32]